MIRKWRRRSRTIARQWLVVAADVTCPRLSFTSAVAELAAGRVLILGTDTLPGFHARADRPAGVTRIQLLKKRLASKPMLVLASSLAQAREFLAPLNESQIDLCQRCWPGPFTLVLPGSDRLDSCLRPDSGTLAVRVPDFSPLRQLIREVGVPLVSTSVNIEGGLPCPSLAVAVDEFGHQVDGYWDEHADSWEPGGLPSALVDLTGSRPAVIRQGPQHFPPA